MCEQVLRKKSDRGNLCHLKDRPPTSSVLFSTIFEMHNKLTIYKWSVVDSHGCVCPTVPTSPVRFHLSVCKVWTTSEQTWVQDAMSYNIDIQVKMFEQQTTEESWTSFFGKELGCRPCSPLNEAICWSLCSRLWLSLLCLSALFCHIGTTF